MNALEKLGYVKQEYSSEDTEATYTHKTRAEKIVLDSGFCCKSTYDFNDKEWRKGWSDKAELKAILELMEV